MKNTLVLNVNQMKDSKAKDIWRSISKTFIIYYDNIDHLQIIDFQMRNFLYNTKKLFISDRLQ